MAKNYRVGDKYFKKCRKTAMQELDDCWTDSRNHVHQFIDDITSHMNAANDEFKQLREHFARETQVIQKRLAESEKARERYRKERNEMKTEIERFRREVKQTEAQEELRREIEKLQIMFEQTNKEWGRKLKESEDSSDEIIRVQKQKIEQYELDLKKQKVKVKILEEQIEKSKFSFSDIDKLTEKLDETEKQLHDTNDRLISVTLKLKETEKELDDTKTRLCKSIGDKLTDKNPNIADLSDIYRPTKLTERYYDLYDSQWTEAFEQIQEEVHSDSDEEISNILLQILLDISGFCSNRAKQQLDDLKKTILCSDSLYVSNLRNESGQPNYALRITLFVKECIEICWLMANQDPQAVFAPSAIRGEILNTELFKAYIKNGPYVEFVVLPAMLLHKGGPVLAKGIANGKGDNAQRHKDYWTVEEKVLTDERGMTKNQPGVQDTDYVYHHGRSSYDRTPMRKVYKTTTQTYSYTEIPKSEESSHIRKENHQQPRSAEEQKHTTGESSAKDSSKSSYERDPTAEEMKTFFRFHDRCDYIGAKKVLGDKVYGRCLRNAYKRHEYH